MLDDVSLINTQQEGKRAGGEMVMKPIGQVSLTTDELLSTDCRAHQVDEVRNDVKCASLLHGQAGIRVWDHDR